MTDGYELQVNSYDRASSILVALLLVSAAVVMGLIIVFFTSRVVTVNPAIPVTPVNAGDGDNPAQKGAEQVSTPGIENAPEELMPELTPTLNVMAGIVSAQLALFDDQALDSPAQPSKGDGVGDRRGVSDGGGVREPQRQLRFQPDSLEQYAQWLDSAGIELGVLGADDRVYYASSLSSPTPTVRDGLPTEESRLYFNTSGGPLEPLDRQLVAKAGLAGRGEIILLFCGPQTQQRLLTLERERAGGRPIKEVAVTVFRVRPTSQGFELSVEEQTFKF